MCLFFTNTPTFSSHFTLLSRSLHPTDKQLRQLVKPFTLLALQNEAIKQTREQELAKEEEEQKRRQQEKEKEMEKIKKEAEEEARKKAEKAAAELLKADQEAKAFKAAAIAKQKEAMREIDSKSQPRQSSYFRGVFLSLSFFLFWCCGN